MEGKFLRSIATAYEELDEDAFTDTARPHPPLRQTPLPRAHLPKRTCPHATPTSPYRAPRALRWQVREYDAIARLDLQKTTLLLEIKEKIKNNQEDIT